MSVVGPAQIPVEVLGGLVSNIAPQSLPPGVSPDCADVAFEPGTPGTVKTRPGMTLKHAFAGNVQTDYLTSYIDQRGIVHNLYLNGDGSMYDESPQGTYTQFSVGQMQMNDFAKSDTAFGSEFIGFSDGQYGIDIPRRYRATSESNTFDRVSQLGPGLAPSVQDYIASENIVAGTAGLLVVIPTIAALSQVGDVVTITPSGGGAFANSQVGDTVTIAGNGDGYNGSFPISKIISENVANLINPATGLPPSSGGTVNTGLVAVVTSPFFSPSPAVGNFITIAGADDSTFDGTFPVRVLTGGVAQFIVYNPTNSGTNSGGGTATVVGNVSAGTHQCSVCFVTRNGLITAPAPPGSWIAAGSLSAIVSQIPIGPPNVIARLLIFTAAGGADFFYSQSDGMGISNMLVPDNTSTTAIVDFTDLALLSSNSADLLFDRIQLPEVAAMLQFGDRIMAWGGRNMVPNFENMSFDGGVSALGGYPLGWTQDPTYGLGGSTTNSTLFGFDYVIDDAGTGERGMIYQSAYQDYLGVAILSPLTNYSLRVRLKRSSAQANDGELYVRIYDPFTSTILATTLLSLANVGTKFSEYIVPFDAEMPATIPSTARLYVFANWFSSGSNSLHVKNLEIFPTDQPFSPSVLYASNVADPEAFQGVTGFLNINENDGHRLTALSIIRDRLYMMKNIAGMFVTTDDPSNEPSGWTVDTISRRVGCESINGMGAKVGDDGEDWFFIVAREGLYIFWSSEPPKISQEIEPNWQTINWDYGYALWLQVDTAKKRVYVGAPIGTTRPSKILCMDYQQAGSTAEGIASAAPVTPNYAGQVKAHTTARKWSPWNIQANAMAFLENSDGTAHPTLALNVQAPVLPEALYELDEFATDDAGIEIPGGGYYVTSFYPSDEQKQTLQFKGNRCLQRYLTLSVDGQGDLDIQSFGPGFVNSKLVPQVGAPALALSNPSFQDLEVYTNFTAERVANKITGKTGSQPNWSLSNMQIYIAEDPVAPLRGVNQ